MKRTCLYCHDPLWTKREICDECLRLMNEAADEAVRNAVRADQEVDERARPLYRRNDVFRAGRDPLTADLQYHGS